MTPKEIIAKYLAINTAEAVKERAAKLLVETGGNSSMYADGLGVVGHVIGLELNNSFGSDHCAQPMVETILAQLNIPRGWVPPGPALQDALALLVKASQVLEPLFRDPENVSAMYRQMLSPDWRGPLHLLIDLADEYDSADEVLGLSAEKVAELRKKVFRY